MFMYGDEGPPEKEDGTTLIIILGLVALATLLIPSTARPELQHPTSEVEQVKQDSAYNCGSMLMQKAGMPEDKARDLPKLYAQASVDQSQEFLKYLFAMMYVESRFVNTAVSQVGAKGLMQLTEPAVVDSRKHCSISHKDSSKLFDPITSIRLGSCYLSMLLRETNNDYDLAVIGYNGGFLQMNKFQREENIAGESANYLIQVKRAIKQCETNGVQK